MFGDVDQRLLGDAIEGGVDFVAQPAGLETARVQIGVDAKMLRPVPHVIGQRGDEAEIVEGRRAQARDDQLEVGIELPCHRFQRCELLAEHAAPAALVPQRRQLQCQRAQLLPELVVHLERNPPAFLFLCLHDLAEQSCPLGVRLLALGDVNGRPHIFDDLADLVHDRTTEAVDMPDRAVRPYEPELAIETGAIANRRFEGLIHRIPVLRMNQRPHALERRRERLGVGAGDPEIFERPEQLS